MIDIKLINRAKIKSPYTDAVATTCAKNCSRRAGERQEPRKLAIVAVARKLVTLANAILRSNQPWTANHQLD